MYIQPKPGAWSWLFQRVTAVLLTVGLFVHFWALHFAFDKPLTFEKVALRLRSPGWVTFDVILLGCALYHGLNGLYAIVLDLKPNAKLHSVTIWGLWVMGLVCLMWGLHIFIPFMK